MYDVLLGISAELSDARTVSDEGLRVPILLAPHTHHTRTHPRAHRAKAGGVGHRGRMAASGATPGRLRKPQVSKLGLQRLHGLGQVTSLYEP